MKTTIYYFTGTGNSLAVARWIAFGLGNTELIGIPSLRDETRVIPDARRVGIVCPVHGFTIPGLVTEFIAKLDLPGVYYTFAIVTYAGMPGGALRYIRRVLRRAGNNLDLGFAVRMPSNDIALSDVQPKEVQRKILTAAEEKLQAIVWAIVKGEHRVRAGTPLSWFPTATVGTLLARRRHSVDKRFSVDERCIGCGVCVQVCPAENILLVNDRPRWHHRCEACMACINYCPERAIQYGKNTARRGRYHHPEVSASDLAAQKVKSSGSPFA